VILATTGLCYLLINTTDSMVYIRGLQTFLPECHISYCTAVREPDFWSELCRKFDENHSSSLFLHSKVDVLFYDNLTSTLQTFTNHSHYCCLMFARHFLLSLPWCDFYVQIVLVNYCQNLIVVKIILSCVLNWMSL